MTTLKTTTMHNENKTITKAKTLLAKGISSIAKESHLVLKSGADIVAHLEAKAVNKLTDIKYDDIIEDRHNETEDSQERAKDLANRLSAQFNKATEGKTTVTPLGSLVTFNTLG